MSDIKAFPIPDGSYNDGMTLRDYFAAKAMQGVMQADSNDTLSWEHVAAMSYAAADAMLKARGES